MRMLSTNKRLEVEKIINRLSKGEEVSLNERIKLDKYALHIPFISRKIKLALLNRSVLEKEGLI